MLRIGNKGQSGIGITVGATMLIFGVVFLLIGIFVSDQMINTINSSMDVNSSGAAAFNGIANNVWSGFKISGIALIVIGAVVILSLLKNAF